MRTATRLIAAIRANDDRLGGVEDMLREFALSTKEGLALMVLAEALLRVPDARTADQFIEDKLGQGDFVHHETRSSAFLVNASAWALGMSARVIQPGETPQGTIGRLTKRLGAPAVRAATRQAMRLMGSHFVLGETIESALARAHSAGGPRYSFDMLGEGARTAADAERYFNAYASAIEAIGGSAGDRPLPDRPGISVKLSALHPRFEALSRARVMAELVPRLIDLARRAKAYELNFTVDAEEADRLELSLEVIAAAFGDASLQGWDGFGLAIQAYQKRAEAVIDYVDQLAQALEPPADGAPRQRRLLGHRDQARAGARPRRLSGVHPQGDDRSQLRGLRAETVGAAAAAVPAIRHPQRADGGDRAGTRRRRQRIRVPAPARHGRSAVRAIERGSSRNWPIGPMRRSAATAICWPIWCGGCWRTAPIPPSWRSPPTMRCRWRRCCAARPISSAAAANARHPKIPLPRDLYRPQRQNSRGIEFGERAALNELLAAIAAETSPVAAAPLINGETKAGTARPVVSPIDPTISVGSVIDPTPAHAREAIAAAREGFWSWSRTPAETPRGNPGASRGPAGATARAFHRAAAARGRQDARRRAFRSPRGRRFLPLLRRRRPQTVRRRRDACRGRPARATCSSCAAAAYSSRSRRGIFRWRFSPAR